MLGGYAPRTAFGRGTFSSFLLPDSPDLSRVPDQSGRDRTAANYVVYWPTDQPQRADDDAAWTVGPAKFAFRRSQLDPATGRLQNGGGSTTGWSFHVTSTRSRDTGQARQDTAALPPFPTRCPCCGADWERRYDTTGKQRAASDPARFQSPVRTMRTGFEKINQVLSDELVEQFSKPSERKLIVFTDSRQDAAKLAAGMALRHYQDLVRLLALEELHASAAPVSDIGAVKLHADGDRSPEVLAAMARLGAKHPAAFNELRLAWIDGEAKHAEAVAQRLAEPPTLDALAKNHVFGRLVALGVNPAGTLHSKQRYGNTDWYEIFDWDMKPPAMASASPAQQEVALASEDGLLDNALEALFSGAGRDVESLGVGLVGPAPQPADPDGLGQASLRILAEMRRFPAMRDASDAPPPRLRDFWKAVAALRGWQYDDVRDTAERAWGGAVFQYLIDPRKAAVRPSPGRAWKCAACGRRHLSPAAGVCTRCHSALPAQPAPDTAPQDGDYYAWKARKAGGGFRLNCAELTGQTGRIEAQSRQARFQGVFLSDRGEIPLVHEIDLLSVTTTMEAGVDIGPLSAVAMANMPPSRFNYQQRVGRAGRRSSPVAVALTVCRGRSHDEHYFANPAAITNDPTPPPYLTLQQPQIMRRAMNAEILRLSFQHLSDHGGTNNPHGEFGLAEDWADAEQDVRAWLDSHGDLVGQALHALSAYTPLDTAPYQDGSWIASLLAEVSEAAQAPTGAPELSERLAHAGVLPMFGFPTRVRQLYLEVPGKNATWPPELAVDRDIALAVSQFAPGGEVVKDGQVYTVVGVTEFEPAPGRAPQPVAEPLEHSRRVGLCRVCNHIEEAPTTDPLCPLCRADNYQVVDLREPAGFRAREPRDFDGNFAWSPRTVSSRATADFNSLSFMPYLGSHVYSGPGNRFVVNDNNGDLFSFQRASGRWGGYIESRIAQEDKGEKGYGSPIEGIALGAVLPTDFFFIGPSTTTDAERGYRLNLSPAAPAYGADINDGRRAAWYSLAFLLRGTAALHLDVGRQELLAGIHHGAHPDGHAVYAFLADSLENGAGFSTHLGSRQGIDPFMDSVHTFIEQLHQREHADLCTSSCYRCLRDYSNMAYHSLLDWRLAADLFAVLTNGHLSPSGPRAIAALDGLRSLLKGTLIDAGAVPALTFTAKGSPWALIVKHPLAACDLDLVSPELSDTLDAALAHTRNAKRIIVADWFTLEKSPMQVLDRLNAGY
jgi:hypothetical protein